MRGQRDVLDSSITEEAARLARISGGEVTPSPLVRTHARSVADGLLDLVDAHNADLLVVGAHHHRHLHLPSYDHTRAAPRRMPCAVAVAPQGYSMRPARLIASVGVGYVDDEDGRLVLDAARAIAWQLGADVYATTIVAASNWPDAQAGIGWRATAAQRRMTEIPGVHGRAVEGEPHRVLAAMSADVDLLVIGHHHHGALRRLVLGDVAEDLASRSRCPLLVVPEASPHS